MYIRVISIVSNVLCYTSGVRSITGMGIENQSNLEVTRMIWVHDREDAEMIAVTVLKTGSAVCMLWSRNQFTALLSYRVMITPVTRTNYRSDQELRIHWRSSESKYTRTASQLG